MTLLQAKVSFTTEETDVLVSIFATLEIQKKMTSAKRSQKIVWADIPRRLEEAGFPGRKGDQWKERIKYL